MMIDSGKHEEYQTENKSSTIRDAGHWAVIIPPMPAVPLIEPATLNAYRETEYRVFAPVPFVLRIDDPSEALLAQHKKHGVECSAFITACNPFSEQASDEANARHQARLAFCLAQRGLKFDHGIGQHPTNGWPGEPSFLVYGLALQAARRLGMECLQSAIVWSGADAVPQLVLLEQRAPGQLSSNP